MSPEPPYGCAIIVYRQATEGRELLMLHRAHHGADYEGGCAWTPPSGSLLPGEAPDDCAQRKLREETRLSLLLHATTCDSPEWYAYLAEAPDGARIILEAEHDRYVWRAPRDAVQRSAPEAARVALACVVALLDPEHGHHAIG